MLNAISGYLVIGLISFISVVFAPSKTIYKTRSGTIVFVSEAPLETIKAKSEDLKGVIDTVKNTFAFSVNINSFKGFNSPLQQQHFYENYMESTAYPTATFSGKIIEIINYSRDGMYEIRAKGILNIHGVKSERIIKATVEINKDEILIKSSFSINLQDHNIKIPRIVFQKIAPDILVNIEAVLVPFQI
jgi:hypothetical protein